MNHEEQLTCPICSDTGHVHGMIDYSNAIILWLCFPQNKFHHI